MINSRNTTSNQRKHHLNHMHVPIQMKSATLSTNSFQVKNRGTRGKTLQKQSESHTFGLVVIHLDFLGPKSHEKDNLGDFSCCDRLEGKLNGAKRLWAWVLVVWCYSNHERRRSQSFRENSILSTLNPIRKGH